MSSLSLNESYTLFIDGIDIRPYEINYDDYFDCIKGLANAVWSLNSDFFGNIKGSRGRLRVVLLVRPDIFDTLGLQNQNSKVKDNSVILEWKTTYPEHRQSDIFLLIDKLLSYQQDEKLKPGQAWDYYFPFHARKVAYSYSEITSFISILRNTLYRPRDVLVILNILQENFRELRRSTNSIFSESDLSSPAFTRKYSDYFLGEIKDHLSFYYPASDYEYFIKFFQFLEGNSRFTYDEFLIAYRKYERFLDGNNVKKPGFCLGVDQFLQFLYEMNVLGYVIDTDENHFFGWCFRERSPSKFRQKSRLGFDMICIMRL